MHMGCLERSISASSVAGCIAPLFLRFTFSVDAHVPEDFSDPRPKYRRGHVCFFHRRPCILQQHRCLYQNLCVIRYHMSHRKPASCHYDLMTAFFFSCRRALSLGSVVPQPMACAIHSGGVRWRRLLGSFSLFSLLLFARADGSVP